MNTPTRTAFLVAYETALIETYAWASDAEKLARFLASAATTINTDATTANLTDSPAAQSAFRAIGCKGRLTYKALRALPA